MGYTRAEAIMIPLGMVVVLLLGITLRRLLKEKDHRVREIPLQVLAVMILVLEVIKQIYHLFIMRDWEPWDLPMHFCSFFLIWFTFALFSRGQVRQLAYSCCLCGGVLVTIMLLACPRMIVNVACQNIFGSFPSFHTYIFHFTVVAYWEWLLLLRVYQPNKNHIWQTTLLYMASFVLIIIAAFAFNTNYTNVLTTDIGILENLRLSAGQFVYDLLLYLGGTAMIAAVATVVYFTTNATARRLNRLDRQA